MDTVLAVSAVVLAAFCIWLAVRIVNRRRMSRWMMWAAALAAAGLAYPLSFGPACRLVEEGVMPYSHVERAYQPCVRIAIRDFLAGDGLLWWWVDQRGGGAVPVETVVLQDLADSPQVIISPFPPTRIWYGPPWTYLCGHFWPCYAGCIALVAATVVGGWRMMRTRGSA
jgi:hypothetical protein